MIAEMPEKYRLVMLGRAGVGKSALTVKYLTQRFIMDYDPYLDGKYSKVDVISSEPVAVKVWDTYTQPGSCINLDDYRKWSDGFMVVYSITDRSSFLEAQAYLKHIHIQSRNSGMDLPPIILVGNKVDLDLHRQVTHKEAQEVANKFGTLFHECSAAGNILSVEAAYHALVRDIQHDRELSSPSSNTFDNLSLTGSLPKAFLGSRRSKSSPKLLKKSSSTFKLFNRSFKFFT